MSEERFDNIRIGIIGFGYVGRAIHYGFKNVADIRIYDVNPDICRNTLKDTVDNSDFIFICVPTPTDIETGECDISIIDDVLSKIKKIGPYRHITESKYDEKIYIIKSSIVPGTMEELQTKYPIRRMVYNPEFLTEKNYKNDFVNPSRVILGGSTIDCLEVEILYRKIYPHDVIPIFTTTAKMAETVKYLSNAFLASKVSIFNEFYDICDKLDVDFNKVRKMITADTRINDAHTVVPGHDGDRGFGGKCFPKDMMAIIKKAEDIGIDPIILKSALEKNNKIRKKKDWLDIDGAVKK